MTQYLYRVSGRDEVLQQKQKRKTLYLLYCTVSPRFSWYENHAWRPTSLWASHVLYTNVAKRLEHRASHPASITGDNGKKKGLIKGKGEGGRGLDRNFIIPIPREATSVATMTGLLPALNSFKTQSLSCCCLSPWIAVFSR